MDNNWITMNLAELEQNWTELDRVSFDCIEESCWQDTNELNSINLN